jgi:hypothetical protein
MERVPGYWQAPPPPPPAPPKRKHTVRNVVLFVLAIIVVLAIIGAVSDDTRDGFNDGISGNSLSDENESQIQALAAQLTWDKLSTSEQRQMCDGLDQFGEEFALAGIMTGTDDLELAEALLAKIKSEC